MKTAELKQLVQDVLSKRRPPDALRPQLTELVRLAGNDCDVHDALDQLDSVTGDDVACLLRALGAVEESGSEPDIDEGEASAVREAIGVLCAEAPRVEMELVRGLDPLLLDGAIEGASNIFRRLTREGDSAWWTWTGLVLHPGGVVGRADVEFELARYLARWAQDGQPAPEIKRVAEWLRRAVLRVPELFRHVHADANGSFFVTLVPKPRDQWSRSRLERWSRRPAESFAPPALPRSAASMRSTAPRGSERYARLRSGADVVRINIWGGVPETRLYALIARLLPNATAVMRLEDVDVDVLTGPSSSDEVEAVVLHQAVAVAWLERARDRAGSMNPEASGAGERYGRVPR